MLDPAIKDLARGKNFAMLSFTMPDGRIASHVMWVDATDEHVLVNTEVHRAKYKAISSNRQVTVTVWNAENPYNYGEVRGELAGEIRGDKARAQIDVLAQKYMGQDYPGAIESERVILQIAPLRQRLWGG